MASNSIRSNLTKEDIISDITLCMGADIDRKNIYLLVEGVVCSKRLLNQAVGSLLEHTT